MKRKKIIGIPKSLFYYRYGVLLKHFFLKLKCKIIYSKKEIISLQNYCTPLKKYINDINALKDECDHVITLKEQKISLCNQTNNIEEKILTKRQILEFYLNYKNKIQLFYTLFKIGFKITKNIPRIILSIIKANKKQKNYNKNKENYQKHLIEKDNKKVLLLAPFYLLEDTSITNNITTILKNYNIIPIYSSRLNKKISLNFSDYYQEKVEDINLKEIIGAYHFYHDIINGIIYIYNSPCELNSIIKNTTILSNNSIPLINININNYDEKSIIELIKEII